MESSFKPIATIQLVFTSVRQRLWSLFGWSLLGMILIQLLQALINRILGNAAINFYELPLLLNSASQIGLGVFGIFIIGALSSIALNGWLSVYLSNLGISAIRGQDFQVNQAISSASRRLFSALVFSLLTSIIFFSIWLVYFVIVSALFNEGLLGVGWVMGVILGACALASTLYVFAGLITVYPMIAVENRGLDAIAAGWRVTRGNRLLIIAYLILWILIFLAAVIVVGLISMLFVSLFSLIGTGIFIGVIISVIAGIALVIPCLGAATTIIPAVYEMLVGDKNNAIEVFE